MPTYSAWFPKDALDADSFAFGVLETRQKLDDKRREMVKHYKHCPKNPKRPKFSDGSGYEIRLGPQEAESNA